MADPFAFWVFLVLLAGTAAVIWLLTGRVLRHEDDLEADERADEAAWISATITAAGGDVPEAVAGQVLELHRRYLEGRAPAPDEAWLEEGEAEHGGPVPRGSDPARIRTGR